MSYFTNSMLQTQNHFFKYFKHAIYLFLLYTNIYISKFLLTAIFQVFLLYEQLIKTFSSGQCSGQSFLKFLSQNGHFLLVMLHVLRKVIKSGCTYVPEFTGPVKYPSCPAYFQTQLVENKQKTKINKACMFHIKGTRRNFKFSYK